MNDFSDSSTTRLLLDRVRGLEPMIREHAPRFESDRRVSAEVMDAIRDAGFFRLFTPESLGGLELDLPSAYEIFEAFADIDSAIGWTVPNSNGPAMAGAALDSAAAEEIYGNPNTILAGAPYPPGKARRVAGGFRVSGKIAYVSGCDHANWIAGSSFIYDEDGNREADEDGNAIRLRTLFRTEDVEITDNWDTLGMRGTGSHDVVVSDAFVEEKFSHVLGPIEHRNPAFSGPLYRCGAIASAPFVTVVCLSSANSALMSALELASKKTPAYMPATVGDRPVAQAQLAEAKGKIDGARLYLKKTIEDLWRNAVSGNTPSNELKTSLQIAASHGTKAAGDALSLIYEVVTSSGVHRALPFERHLRDVQTLMTHAFTSTARFESAGKLLVGRETDWFFLY